MGQSKLDQHLTRICNFIGWLTLRALVVLFIIEAIEQIVMHFNLNQMIAVFLSVSAIGIVIIETIVRKQIEKQEKEED